MTKILPSIPTGKYITCTVDQGLSDKWGYIFCRRSDVAARKLTRAYMPIWYGRNILKGVESTSFSAHPIRPMRKKPPIYFTKYETDGIEQRPLRDDCIIVHGPNMVKLLEKLTLQYKYQYVMRCVRDRNKIRSCLKNGNAALKNKTLVCVLFRTKDVFPAEIAKTDGIYVIVHDGSYSFLELVFSNTKNLFDVDGLKFEQDLNYDDAILVAENTIKTLEQLKSKTLIKPTQPQYTITQTSHTLGGSAYTFSFSSVANTSTVRWTRY